MTKKRSREEDNKNDTNFRPAKKAKVEIDNKTENSSMNQVLPNLFIGPIEARADVKRFKIKHIFAFISSSVRDYRVPKSVKEHQYRIYDSVNTYLKPTLEDCLPKIHKAIQANENVLVHCHAGISRSASVVIAYLMKYKKMYLYHAIDHLKRVRPCINPNDSFLEQLQILENERKGNIDTTCLNPLVQ